MAVSLPLHLILGCGLFAIGTVVGSFLNVCIYRIPWQKSVVWPDSRCPKCLHSIAARDNVPILSWVFLGGACRHCGLPIAARYPAVEALVGLLFAGAYVTDVAFGPRSYWGEMPSFLAVVLFYHLILIALLIAATFIDYDLWTIPDEIPVTGIVLGLALGTLFPEVRPDPSKATTSAGGLWAGVAGLLAGGGLTWSVRILGRVVFRREAMGFGDVTLMAMIGAFLGWQAAVLTFFLAPFFGLAHALWKLVKYLGKRLSGREFSSADREMPFGPYLSMAAISLLLSWPWLWPGWAKPNFELLRELLGELLHVMLRMLL